MRQVCCGAAASVKLVPAWIVKWEWHKWNWMLQLDHRKSRAGGDKRTSSVCTPILIAVEGTGLVDSGNAIYDDCSSARAGNRACI